MVYVLECHLNKGICQLYVDIENDKVIALGKGSMRENHLITFKPGIITGE